MKKLMIIALALGISTTAFADGFVCQARNGSLDIKAYNSTQTSHGTRKGAVMLLSDPNATQGEKTIARFTQAEGTLTNYGASYTARVDLRFKDQRRKEALVANKVRLEQLDTIQLNVDFNYAEPVRAGDYVNGTALLNTRSGDQIALDVECQRYLKN